MDLLCLDSRKLGERGALIVRTWKCQNWPMKVSKDHNLKARQMFKCSCHIMKSERGADAWNKFEEITHQCFLTCLGQHVPLKINVGFTKVWRKIFFGEDDDFHAKEFRTTLTVHTVQISSDTCIYIYAYLYIYI